MFAVTLARDVLTILNPVTSNVPLEHTVTSATLGSDLSPSWQLPTIISLPVVLSALRTTSVPPSTHTRESAPGSSHSATRLPFHRRIVPPCTSRNGAVFSFSLLPPASV